MYLKKIFTTVHNSTEQRLNGLAHAAPIFFFIFSFLWWVYRSAQGLNYIEFGDESLRFTIVQHMNHGARLYRDVIDHQGPGTFFLAWVFNSFGAETIAQYRFATLAFPMLAISSLVLSPAWSNIQQGLIAGGTYALVTGTLQIGWLGQMLMYQTVSGHLVVAAFTLVIAPLLVGNTLRPRHLLIAGASWSLALFTAISSFISVVMFGLALVLLAWLKKGRQDAMRHTFWFLVGGFAAAIVFAIWITFQSDWLGLFAYHVYFNTEIYAGYINLKPDSMMNLVRVALSEELDSQAFLARLMIVIGTLGLAHFILGSLFWYRLAPRISLALAMFIWFLLMTIYMDPRGASHWHAASVYCLCSAYLALAAGRINQAPNIQKLMFGVLMLPASSAIIYAYFNVETIYDSRINAATIQSDAGLDALKFTPTNIAIRAAVDPGETIIAYPYFPSTYYYADRLSASAHVNLLPWQVDYIRMPFADVNKDACAEIEKNAPKAAFIGQGMVWGRYSLSDYAPCVVDYVERELVPMNSGDPVLYVHPDRIGRVLDLGLGYTPQNGINQINRVPVGEILPEAKLVQSIALNGSDRVVAIEILFATYMRKNEGRLQVVISDAFDQELLVVKENTADFSDNSYRRYELPRMLESGVYNLEITSLDSVPGQAVTVWARRPSISPLTIGEQPSDLSLCLVFHLADGSRQITPGCPSL